MTCMDGEERETVIQSMVLQVVTVAYLTWFRISSSTC